MDSQQNLFNMVDEMGSIIIALQSNMMKVMDGINQLNLIISKINQYKANNNIMNNMFNNIQNINMGMNNMMNIPNIQMPMNNMINNMNMNPIKPYLWNLIFEEQGTRKSFTIHISPQKLVKEAIKNYQTLSGRNNKLRFVCNNKILNPEDKICESGLNDMSTILVIFKDVLIGG